MQLVINVPDEVRVQAEARGLDPEAYAECLIREDLARAKPPRSLESVEAAVDEIRRLRQGVRLDGLSIKELINEGRKY